MSEANRIKAWNLVAKHGHHYPASEVPNPEWRYGVSLPAKVFHAPNYSTLVDKVAAYLDSLEQKKAAQ